LLTCVKKCCNGHADGTSARNLTLKHKVNISVPSSVVKLLGNVYIIAVGDRIFWGCKVLIFAQTELNFAQIYPIYPNFLKFYSNLSKCYPNLPKLCPNWPKFCSNLPKKIC